MNISLQTYRDLLITYLRPQQVQVVWLAVLLLVNIGLQLLNPQIMRRFIDNALVGVQTDQLPRLALAFIGVALLQQAAAVTATYLGENVSWTATNWLRYDLARHCLHLDMSFHNRHTPGAMIERIDGDINTLSQFFSQFVLQVLSNLLLLVGVLVLLLRENLGLGLALTVFALATLAVLTWLRNAAIPHWKAARAASADFFGFLEERLAATEDIRTSGAIAYVMRRFAELLQTFWRTAVGAQLRASGMINIAWVLFSIGTAVAFLFGANLYQSGVLTLGAVYLVVYYTGMLSQPMERIAQEFERLQQAGAGLARIQELRQEESRLTLPARPQLLPPGPLCLAFEQIAFAYPDDTPNGKTNGSLDGAQPTETTELVLHDISFRLEAGKVLGLLGRTGSGKTTLARLLFRLYDPQSGSVCVNGTDIRQVDLAQLRQRVGVVNQNVQLFRAPLRDNLTFFDSAIPDKMILEVLHELGLQGWYASLPAGLDTVLEARGGNLSAGEAQLLALARIFLKDPGILIFDEASSRLDPVTEQLIERATDRLLQNRTAIIIAHRLATVQRADEILILDGGRIWEHGPRRQLAADPTSRFSELMHTGMTEVLV